MITIRDRIHAARLLRHFREQLGLSRREIAARLFVSMGTVLKREHFERTLKIEDLIDHASVLGFDVALIPARHAGARPTGTGWPT